MKIFLTWDNLNDFIKEKEYNEIRIKKGRKHLLHKYIKMIIPEPCRVPDNSETSQGSGKKPDNDGVAWTTASAQ